MLYIVLNLMLFGFTTGEEQSERCWPLLVFHSLALRLSSISLLVKERGMIKVPVILQCWDGCSPGATYNHFLFGVTGGKIGWNWIIYHREKCGSDLIYTYAAFSAVAYAFPFSSAIFLLLTCPLFQNPGMLTTENPYCYL